MSQVEQIFIRNNSIKDKNNSGIIKGEKIEKMEPKNKIVIKIEEWKKKSELGEVCGILGCGGKPSKFCRHCGNWYCEDHSFVLKLPTHQMILVEKDKLNKGS